MHHRYAWFIGLVSAIVVLLSLMVPPRSMSASGASTADYVVNEVLLKLKPTADIFAIAAAYGLDTSPGTIDRLESRPVYRLRIIDGTSPPVKAAALAKNSQVVYAEPNYLGQAPEATQQSAWSKGDWDLGNYQTQWAPATIRLLEAHTVSRGAGIIVAVLDTGADLSHPALVGRLVPGFDFVDLDTDPSEEGMYGRDIAYGHGTHVAGLVALSAPEAKIMPLRILKPDGTGNSWLLAQAVRYAAARGVGVINVSYTVKHRSMVIDEILSEVTSVQPGAVVAAAAGNSGGTDPEYPAAEGIPGLLAVAASTKSDHLASFSTYGPWVQVAAPGQSIVSSVPLSSGSAYAAWSGTSMAAPLTAGTAALVRAAYPNLSPAEVAQRITETAARIKGPVPRRVDAAAALGLPATRP
jgi:subtilisin family serine protease